MLGRRAEALRFATDLRAEMVAANAEWGDKNFDEFEDRVKKKAAGISRRESYAKWYAQHKQWVSGLTEWNSNQLAQAAQLLYLTIQQEAADIFIFPMEKTDNDSEHADKQRVIRFTPEIEEVLRTRMDKVCGAHPISARCQASLTVGVSGTARITSKSWLYAYLWCAMCGSSRLTS